MKATHHAVWLLVLAALQPTLLNYIKICGAKPNLFLIFIVIMALLSGKRDGAVVGAAFGLMFDLLTGKMIGLHAVLYMYLGFFFGLMSENVLKKPTVIISALAVLIASPLTGCAEFLFRTFRVAELPFFYSFMYTILPEMIYSTVFSIPVYWILKKTAGIFFLNRKVNEL